MPGTGIEFVSNHTGVFGRVLRTYPTNTGTLRIFVQGIPVPGVYLSARTEVSGTGIELVPNHTEVLGNRSKPCQR